MASSYNENSYRNAEFDHLYERMNSMEPGPGRERIIHQMNDVLERDAPVVFLFHPVSYGLTHSWVSPLRPHPINSNQLKYRNLDPEKRKKLAEKWNHTPLWGILTLGGVLLLTGFGIFQTLRQYRKMVR